MPSTRLALLTAALALLAVLVPAVWSLGRGVVTTLHEAGHAVAGLAVGRQLKRVRLHGSGGGDTLTAGRRTGPGLVVTLAAGYPAPSLAGLAGAAWLAADRPAEGVLLPGLVLVIAMLLYTRNLYGLVLLVATGALLGVGIWRADEPAQVFAAYAITWFLLIGGVRAVAVLLRPAHRRGPSDADQLARLTRVPAPLWVLLFGTVSVAALLFGGGWLLDLPWWA